VNIISGSMPVFENNDLYNVSYLLHRDGRIDEYRKFTSRPMKKVLWNERGK
jgi:hypothetical protein